MYNLSSLAKKLRILDGYVCSTCKCGMSKDHYTVNNSVGDDNTICYECWEHNTRHIKLNWSPLHKTETDCSNKDCSLWWRIPSFRPYKIICKHEGQEYIKKIHLCKECYWKIIGY